MQRLNIPFSRTAQTTRPSQRVVWHMVFGIAVFAALGYGISWFCLSGDALIRKIPDQTTTTLRFFLNKGTAGELSETFSQIPLISNRNITLADLSPYLKGEFALYLTDTGTYSMAGKFKTNKDFEKLLGSYNISYTKTSRNTYYLSNKPESLTKQHVSIKWLPTIVPPWKKHIAEIVQNNKRGNIISSKDGWSVSIPSKNTPGKQISFQPEGLVAYLSTPVLPKNNTEPMFRSFSVLLSPLFEHGFESTFTNIFQKNLRIYITKTGESEHFLLVSDSKTQSDQISTFLKVVAALQEPKLNQVVLSDQSISKEMVVDPSRFSPEQTTISGFSVLRLKLKNQTISASISKNDEVLFTNDENLIRTFKEQKKMNLKDVCFGKQAFLLTNQIQHQFSNQSQVIKNQLLLAISSKFTKIGVEETNSTTKIHLCK